MAATSNGNEAASAAKRILDPTDPFEPNVTCIIQNVDQYEMQKHMSAMERDGIQLIFNDNKTFRLEGDWFNVATAIEQLKDLKKRKLASKNTTEENSTEDKKEQTSDNCDPAKPKERNRVLRRDLTPSSRQVDLSLSQRIPIDQHVWYYLECKHPDKVDGIAKQHLCISRVVCERSNEGITHSFEVVPYTQDDSNEATKHVNDVLEEFAPLYQKVSEPGIVKESIELPLALNLGMPQQLIAELEKVGVFFLRSDGPCLIGPRACIEEAKQKLVDFISEHNNRSAQTQPNDNFGLEQASAADRVQPMSFKTPNGLTVHVSKGDLVHQSLDAIVNPANEYLGNGGGAARAIAKAAGDALQWECKDFIRKYGKLELTLVMHTSAGNLRPKIKYVIHTVGPRKSDTKDEEELFGLVKLAVFNCLHYANDELKINSIAIPAISSGIFGVPIEIVGRASFEALKMFDGHYASCKKQSLHEIHFLNNDEATVSNMKRIFQSLKDNQESSVDPEHLVSVTKALDLYATVTRRQRIETTPDDNCFTRALATALQRDLQYSWDWHKVEAVVKKELDSHDDCYKEFQASDEQDTKWPLLMNAWDKMKNFLQIESRKVNPDVWINAATNALKVQIVLVQLSEKQVAVERNVKSMLSEGDKTVYIAYHWCGHHHFDALVKKASAEDNGSGKKMTAGTEDASAETKNKSSASGHSHDMNNGQSFRNRNGDDFEVLTMSEVKDMPLENASNVTGKNSAKEKASYVAGKKADKADDNKKDDDDNHCIICMDDITDKKELSCKHKFCRECIDQYFKKGQPKCPSCGKVFGTLRGDQPPGNMTTREINWQHLAGYNDCGSIEINYSFNNGIQGDNHPNPGKPYRGTHRTAFLPANREGREVLRLLKSAFDAGLVFTIGRSNTTGQENVVIWNDVHHKTSPNGQYGYPDPTYLKRVKEELAAKGIQ